MEFRRVNRLGGSYYVTLPAKWIKELKINLRDWVVVYIFKDRIEIRKQGGK